jgi:hypothetical protein
VVQRQQQPESLPVLRMSPQDFQPLVEVLSPYAIFVTQYVPQGTDRDIYMCILLNLKYRLENFCRNAIIGAMFSLTTVEVRILTEAISYFILSLEMVAPPDDIRKHVIEPLTRIRKDLIETFS